MAFKEPKIEKIYFSIGEVARMLGVSTSLLRFWDKEFSILKLKKNKKGNRIFTQENIKQLRVIHHLVKEKGMTLKGAEAFLMKNRDGASRTGEAVEILISIRQQLADIQKELEDE